MTLNQFGQQIVGLGPGGRRIPETHYYYKHLIKDGEDKLFFRSAGARKDYRILKPKVQEYFAMLKNGEVTVAWFKRNRSQWFHAVFEDVLEMEYPKPRTSPRFCQ